MSRIPVFLIFIAHFLPSFAIAEVLEPFQDFSKAEQGEHLPGGTATSRKRLNRNAFSHSSANMSFERELDFKIGNGFFKRLWVVAPSSTQAADGLGPLYNARSCQRCHLKDGRGHTPKANWSDDNAVSMFLRLSIPPQTPEQRAAIDSHRRSVIPEPVYGGQLQDIAIPGVPAEGRMHITYEEVQVTLSGGEVVFLRKPSYNVTNLGYGPLHPETQLSPRVAPPMIGLGLLEAISNTDILSLADPDDEDGDGISGRPNAIWSEERKQVMIGRFGWKAGEPTIPQQSAHAFAADIGISSPFSQRGAGNCTPAQEACTAAPAGDSPQYDNAEVSREVMDLISFYARNLAVPVRRKAGDPEVLAGKRVFHRSGCIACHQPGYLTENVEALPEQSEQRIWPYTDLLLHDMGEGLADSRPEGVASGREWRTPPLWGIGMTKTVSGHTEFLHDGRARNLLEAILWHGGEAEAAKKEVIEIPETERNDLLKFLNSL